MAQTTTGVKDVTFTSSVSEQKQRRQTGPFEGETKTCSNWRKKGRCNKGDQCRYRHEGEILLTKNRKETKKETKKNTKILNGDKFIVIDGANIGHISVPGQTRSKHFHAFRLEQAVNACQNAGFSVLILLPQYFIASKHKNNLAKDVNTLLDLETQGLLTRLPSNINDDLPIINLAVSRNGYILSNDNFNEMFASQA